MKPLDFESTKDDKRVNWEVFRQAWRQFQGDYAIVNHSHTPDVSCFGRPNQGLDEHGHRFYTRTVLPENMTKGQFDEKYSKEIDTILVACMDRDEIGPLYEQLVAEGKKILLVSIAGGITQERDKDRQKALGNILKYLSQLDRNKTVIVGNHDNNCGYLGWKNEGKKIRETLGLADLAGKIAEDGDLEAQALKAMILNAVKELGLEGRFNHIIPALFKIDRQGEVVIDIDFQDVEAKSMDQVLAEAEARK